MVYTESSIKSIQIAQFKATGDLHVAKRCEFSIGWLYASPAQRGRGVEQLTDISENGSNRVTCFKFNPTNAGQLLTGSWDHTVKVWSVTDGKCERTLTGHR